jgi:trehalose/maltose hydrolase-like predicted phosphorylase
MNTWQLVEDRFVPSMAPARESLFTIANGYLSVRGSFEERTEGETRATFINGLFVTPPGELPLLGAVPDWTEITLTLDGFPFSVHDGLAGYRRRLDLKTGVLDRDVLWQAPETGVFAIKFRRLVSMAEPHLAALQVTVTALTQPADLWLETGIDASVPSPSLPAFNPVEWVRPARNGLHLLAESTDGAHRLTVETALHGVGRLDIIHDPRHHRLAGEIRLKPGHPVTITKYAVFHSDRDRTAPPSVPAAQSGFEEVAAASARAWRRRWRMAAIEIQGDPYAEMAARYAAFQILGASPVRDPGAAIGAKLGSGFGYRHHVFWDADVFIVPYLTVTAPDLARNHLGYRYRGLDGARRKAKKYGRDGAFYAWESAGTGDEVTPEWTSPLFGPPSRIWTGEIEEHITADVAYAADHYWRWTGDDRFLLGEGLEMILEGARYWASRISVEDGAHIRQVIGPDEYHSHVDDSFYTNLLAAWHLRRAAELWSLLQEQSPRRAGDLAARLGMNPADPAGWRPLAQRLVLHRADDGVWEQHLGYFDLDELDLSDFRFRTAPMFDLLGEEGVGRTQVIKQADVVMAMALLPEAVGSPAQRLRNWSYYSPRCDHGSSLSMAVHAWVAADLGLVDEGYDMLLRAIGIDLADEAGNGRDGIHAATQGGILQAILFGFGGLRLEEDQPAHHPPMPAHWEQIGFSFMHHGTRHERELTHDKTNQRLAGSPKRRKKR